MAAPKLYAGAKLREIRTRMSLTQKEFAAKLGVSLPYLNQMENNNRPVSTTVVLSLAQEFGLDVTELSASDGERLVSDMREALADPVFSADLPALADLRLAASNAPALAHAVLDLHRAYRQTHERLASLDEALGREDARAQPSPWEEVRDFFHYCDNYIDAVDRAAEHFATAEGRHGNIRVSAVTTLAKAGVKVTFQDADTLRHRDGDTLFISTRAAPETQTFQLLLQVALTRQDPLQEATLDLARFQRDDCRLEGRDHHAGSEPAQRTAIRPRRAGGFLARGGGEIGAAVQIGLDRQRFFLGGDEDVRCVVFLGWARIGKTRIIGRLQRLRRQRVGQHRLDHLTGRDRPGFVFQRQLRPYGLVPFEGLRQQGLLDQLVKDAVKQYLVW